MMVLCSTLCRVLTRVFLDSKVDYNQNKQASVLRMTSCLRFFLAGVNFIVTINILAAALLKVLRLKD